MCDASFGHCVKQCVTCVARRLPCVRRRALVPRLHSAGAACNTLIGVHATLHALVLCARLHARRLLEQLAAGVVKAGALQRVARLHDQYLAFIALEPTLFSLGMPEAYVELNDPHARDYQIEVGNGTHVKG